MQEPAKKTKKKKVLRKKTEKIEQSNIKTKDCVHSLLELHKLQGVLLNQLNKLWKKGAEVDCRFFGTTKSRRARRKN